MGFPASRRSEGRGQTPQTKHLDPLYLNTPDSKTEISRCVLSSVEHDKTNDTRSQIHRGLFLSRYRAPIEAATIPGLLLRNLISCTIMDIYIYST